MICAAHKICQCGAVACSEYGRWPRFQSCTGFVAWLLHCPVIFPASDRYYKRDITRERFLLNKDSTIDVPRGVGLGVTIDEKALASFTLNRIELKPT